MHVVDVILTYSSHFLRRFPLLHDWAHFDLFERNIGFREKYRSNCYHTLWMEETEMAIVMHRFISSPYFHIEIFHRGVHFLPLKNWQRSWITELQTWAWMVSNRLFEAEKLPWLIVADPPLRVNAWIRSGWMNSDSDRAIFASFCLEVLILYFFKDRTLMN